MEHERPGRLFVVSFADDQELRRAFGATAGAEHLTLVRDAARVVVAGVTRVVEGGVIADPDRVIVLVDPSLLTDGPLESRRDGLVDVVDSPEGLDLVGDATVLVGRMAWGAGLQGWRDGDLSRRDAIHRISRDLVAFISNYTKAA